MPASMNSELWLVGCCSCLVAEECHENGTQEAEEGTLDDTLNLSNGPMAQKLPPSLPLGSFSG